MQAKSGFARLLTNSLHEQLTLHSGLPIFLLQQATVKFLSWSHTIYLPTYQVIDYVVVTKNL